MPLAEFLLAFQMMLLSCEEQELQGIKIPSVFALVLLTFCSAGCRRLPCGYILLQHGLTFSS